MRDDFPVAYVPQLGAALITRRDDIFENEKKVDVFSSVQPEGLMQRLMGQNIDAQGPARITPWNAGPIFPAVSPRTVKDDWEGEISGRNRQDAG